MRLRNVFHVCPVHVVLPLPMYHLVLPLRAFLTTVGSISWSPGPNMPLGRSATVVSSALPLASRTSFSPSI